MYPSKLNTASRESAERDRKQYVHSKKGLKMTRIHLLVSLLAAGVFMALPVAAAQAETCPNENLRYEDKSTRLPDCRAYELVSPAYRSAGSVASFEYDPQTGTSGIMRVTGGFAGTEGFPDLGSGGPTATYTTQRTAVGWTTQPDELPSSEYVAGPGLAFGSDRGGNSLDGQTVALLGRAVGQPDNSIAFFERLPGGALAEVGPALPPTTPALAPPQSPKDLPDLQARASLAAEGLSGDGSHLFFNLGGAEGEGTAGTPPNSASYYWPSDHTQGWRSSLYEYAGTGNREPLLVGVDDEGEQIEPLRYLPRRRAVRRTYSPSTQRGVHGRRHGVLHSTPGTERRMRRTAGRGGVRADRQRRSGRAHGRDLAAERSRLRGLL